MIQADFPIIRQVVYAGKTYEKRLNEGDVVKCWCCGRPIIIGPDTVYISTDGMQIVRCSNWECHKKAAVLDYFDKTITPVQPMKKRKKKYKEYKRNILKEPKPQLLNDKYVKE